MPRTSAVFLLLFAAIVTIGATGGEKPETEKNETKANDVLEGTLRVHPKFHYRYYIDGFGDGQNCALFGADEALRDIKPGTRIRVQGKLASKFFGNASDKNAALVSTWIVYMDVNDVETTSNSES